MKAERLFSRRWFLLAPLVALLVVAGACGDDAGPTPTPLDLSSLTSDIQESIGAAVAGIDIPEAVSESQIRALVESAVSGVEIPEGLTQEDVRSIVNRAVTAAAAEAVTEEDVVRAIAAEVAKSAAAAPEGLSEADIDRIVKGAIPTPLPTPTPAPTATPVPTAAPTAMPAMVLSSELNVALLSLPQQLDVSVIAQLYDTFVGFNLYDNLFDPKITQRANGTAEAPGNQIVEGGLAESWTMDINSDGSVTYTVQLRDNVFSPAGNQMTAADVKYSFDRWFGTQAIGVFLLTVAGNFEKPEDIRVVSEFVIELKTPALHTNNLLAISSTHHSGILDSAEFKKNATAADPWALEWAEKNAAGFGAYQVSNWVPGQQFVYEVNPNYWRGAPFFDTVTIREAPSNSARLAALLTGAVDVTYDLSVDEEAIVDDTSGVSAVRFDGLTVDYMGFKTTVPPFDDVRVRQAVAYAMPYDDIMTGVFKDSPAAERMRSVVPKVHTDYIPAYRYETDLDRARELLEAAGFADGFDMTLTYSTGFSTHEAMAILITSQLKKIGINVTVAVEPISVFRDGLFSHRQQAFIDQNFALIPDTAYAMEVFHTSRACCNFMDYFSQELDDLALDYIGTLDMGERTDIGKQMQRILADEVSWVDIAYPRSTFYHADDIVGWTWYSGNSIVYRHLSRQG